MKPVNPSAINEQDLKTYRQIAYAINELPEKIPDGQHHSIQISSHLLAKAVSDEFQLKLEYGWYSVFHHPHSWIVLPSRNIIDVVPVGIASGPILIDAVNFSPLVEVNYIPLPMVTIRTYNQLRINYKEFRRQAAVVRKFIHDGKSKQATLPL